MDLNTYRDKKKYSEGSGQPCTKKQSPIIFSIATAKNFEDNFSPHWHFPEKKK